METQHKRSAFSGKLGFVLSAAGASVGLGNIWRFPYLAAKYGGGIFLLIYILLAVTFGYTMIIAETALGRMTRKSPVGAYSHFGKGKGLSFGGWINAVIPILIVPYYSVIGGWVIHYLAQYLTGHGSALASDGYFSGFISNGLLAEIAFLLFTFITLGIIFAGVRNGVERVSKVMMPSVNSAKARKQISVTAPLEMKSEKKPSAASAWLWPARYPTRYRMTQPPMTE